jgi:hypothetical protein
MLLLAAPALATEFPGQAKQDNGDQSANVYAKNDDDRDVDCGKLDNDDARKRCREAKNNRNEDDRDVDCGKLDNDDARKRCREAKHNRNDDDRDVDCGKLKDDDARKRCREAKHNN